RDPPCPQQYRQMRGHGVMWHRQLACDLTGRQAFRLMAYQQPEGIETGFLGQRRKTGQGIIRFHTSKHMDIFATCQYAKPDSSMKPVQASGAAILFTHPVANCLGYAPSNRPTVMSVSQISSILKRREYQAPPSL